MFFVTEPVRSRGRFTLGEAAVLAGVEEKSARHSLNEVLGRSAVSLSVRDVLFLALKRDVLSVSSAAAVQRALYRRLHERGFRVAESSEVSLALGGPERPDRVRLVIELRLTVSDLLGRIRSFRKGARRVERRDDVLGGALVFKGTRVPVELVGAQLKDGASSAEIREDFPTLTDADLAFARFFVELSPPRGRPRKRLDIRKR